MPQPDWDDLRLFLAVTRAGTLAAAARRLGVEHTTIARRLTALEAAMGARLFDRSPRGVKATDAGLALAAHAERVEAEVLAATADIGARDLRLSGAVRLATPEAFGTFFIAPNVHRLHARHPELTLELVPESRNVSLSKREADLAIMLHRPPRGRLVARRLVDYRLGLYAARDYLARHAPIATVAEAAAHPFVAYIEEMIDLPELRDLDHAVASEAIAFRSSSIAAQQAAVASGLGLGLLHRFAAEGDSRLAPVLAETVSATRSYWLVLHSDQQRLSRVRAVIDFIDMLVTEQRASF